MRPSIKELYEHENAYEAIISNILKNPRHQLFLVLHAGNKVLPSDDLQKPLLKTCDLPADSKELTTQYLTAASKKSLVLARAIAAPSAIAIKDKHSEESLAALEIRKMCRRPGKATRTEKSDRLNKNGNEHRSVSRLGYGASVYAGQGFLILNPKMEDIEPISQTDNDTGRGKKKESKQEKLERLQKTQKMGGNSRCRGNNYVDTHNEITGRITKADAIYFTNDPTLYNHLAYKDQYPLSPHTHYLQALFLKKEYEKQTGIKLPIFEYSGIDDFFETTVEPTEEEIVEMWVSTVSAFVKKELENGNYKEIKNESLDALKEKSIFCRNHSTAISDPNINLAMAIYPPIHSITPQHSLSPEKILKNSPSPADLLGKSMMEGIANKVEIKLESPLPVNIPPFQQAAM